jgi:hypothetical protein
MVSTGSLRVGILKGEGGNVKCRLRYLGDTQVRREFDHGWRSWIVCQRYRLILTAPSIDPNSKSGCSTTIYPILEICQISGSGNWFVQMVVLKSNEATGMTELCNEIVAIIWLKPRARASG